MLAAVLNTISDNVKLALPANPERYLEIVRIDDPKELAADVKSHLNDYQKLSQPFAISPVLVGEISGTTELCKWESEVKQVYEIELTTAAEIVYAAGSTIGILPENKLENVKLVMSRILEDPDGLYKLQVAANTKKKAAKLPAFVPTLLNIENVLTHCLDLNSITKKLFLRALVEYTSDANEKRALEILCSKEGAVTYSELVVNRRMTFHDLLKALTSCELPFTVLLEHLPRLLPRPYSIASFNSGCLNRFKICFSVEHTDSSSDIRGLTTGLLVKKIQALHSETKQLCFYLRQPTAFQYSSKDLDRNIIMIGPGTGVAPFLGFLQFRESNLQHTASSQCWLFTGCRFRSKNNLYDKEINEYLTKGVLTHLSAAFSRDSGCRFKYVQSCIVEEGEQFVQILMSDRSKLYVCGGKTMLPSIEETVVKSLETYKNISHEDAQKLVGTLKKDGRYIEDLWF